MVANSFLFPRAGLVLIALAVLSACGGGAGDPATPSPNTSTLNARVVDQTDIEIAQLLYSDTQRVPVGFYKDTLPQYPGYIATAHLKNTDITNSADTQFELCTDDYSVALAWSEQAASALLSSTLVETSATDRFNEFIRVKVGSPQGYVRTRIYKCAYLDRSSVDLRAASGQGGLLNQRPLSASALQGLTEYLWQFTSYNNYGNAVLKSSGSIASSGLQHTLVIASLGSSLNGCDRVTVSGWSYLLNMQSGALSHELNSLWEFGAKRNGGLVELCNPSN